MDKKAVAQITLNHRASTQGLAGILPPDSLKALHDRHYESAPLAWVEQIAEMLNTHPCDRIQRQAAELWMVRRLPDAQVQEQILPALSTVAAFDLCADDSERITLWRSLYQPLIQYHRHTLTQPKPEPALPQQKMDAAALRTVLTGHYGKRMIALLEQANRLHMVNTAADLPDAMKARHSSLIESVAGATFGDGTVYLVADKIAPEKAAPIFLHEVGEHAAMAYMLGKDYGRLVQQFRRLLARGDTYATWAAMRVPRSTPAAHVPSEQLAYLVEKVATDQQPDPAGIEGHALGKECLSHLRGWLFRTPLMSWLDSIGEADHFNLSAEDIAALARQAVDVHAQTFSAAPLEKSTASAWLDQLDPAKLDTLFRSNTRQRQMALADSSPETLAGYLYALQAAGAGDIDNTLDEYTPALARMAAGAHGEHLTVIAGELLEYAASRVPVNALNEQMGEGGLAMFRSTATDGTPTLKVITGNTDNELLTVRHFKQNHGYVMHEMLDKAEVAASLTSWVQPVKQENFGTELATFAQVEQSQATGRLDKWRQQAESMAQPMYTTGTDGLACIRGCDLIHLPKSLQEQMSDKPVAIDIDNPVFNRPGDQFITGGEIAEALGKGRAQEILMCEETALYTTPSWASLVTKTGASTIAELAYRAPASMADCELPAALVFSNPTYRQWFADAGYDGAVYAASETADCAAHHVFNAAQIGPYSRFGSIDTSDGMEGIASRFDSYQRDYWDYQSEEAKDMTGLPNAEAVFAASTKMAEAQDALAEAIGVSSFKCIAGETRGGEQVFMTPSPKEAGYWQITRMAGDGLPLSDTHHASKEEACSELLQAITPNSLRLHAETGHLLRPDGRLVEEQQADDDLADQPRNTFVGVNADGADLAKLEQAKEMATKKLSARTIYKETGWFLGIDNQWRYEISDDKASFKHNVIDREALRIELEKNLSFRVEPSGLLTAVYDNLGPAHTAGSGHTEEEAVGNLINHYAKRTMAPPFQYSNVKNGDMLALGDILDHEELLRAYPFLRNMVVEFRTDMDDYFGLHFEEGNRIQINSSRSEEDALSTLLHEVQHAVQGRENFARGGNADTRFTGNIQAMLQHLADESAEAVEAWKADNQRLKSNESQASEVAKSALLYQSMQNLMRYANREAPSGVFRLIRNELAWLHNADIQADPERRAAAREIQFKLYDIPKRGPKRNPAIRDVAYEAAQLYRSCIPTNLLKKFKADERTLKGMVNAMKREAQKANDALEPLRDLKANAVAADSLFRQSKFSSSFEIYRALGGEVESRLTQTRQKLTPAERAERFPWQDSDVSPSEVIVYYRGVKVHLPSVTASMSSETAVAPAQRSYVPDYHMQSWKQETGLPEDVLEQYGRLGELQRGKPENMMLEAQHALSGNPLSTVIEHIGDLTNRMSPKHSVGFAYEESKDKIERQLRSLNSRYGFRRDFDESMKRSAEFQGISIDEHRSKVNAALEEYADAHASLETHNHIQTLARDAAVALGRLEFEKATFLLEELHSRMDSQEAFIRELGGTAGAVSTPEFKEWFGDSQITDNLGRPLVLYHGTNADFDAFDRDATRAQDSIIYATQDQRVASDFAMYRSTWAGANVMPVYVQADKVLEIEGQYRPIRQVEADTQLDGMLPGEDVPTFAKRQGYDAIVYRNTTDDVGPNIAPAADIYALLSTAQLKSAIGNVGTFDRSNDNIRLREADNQTTTAAFSNWFGSSAVVDQETGEPLIVQHRSSTIPEGYTTRSTNMVTGEVTEQHNPGTGKDFSETGHDILYPGGEPGVEAFPLSGTKTARRASEEGLRSGPAIWFADIGENPNTGRKLAEGSVSYPVYLSIQRPLRITTHEQRLELVEKYTPYPETVSVPSADGGNIMVPFRSDFPYRFDGNQRKQLVKDGYDGIILDIPGEQREYIALYSSQAKSAIGNIGTFDPNNDDMRFSRLEANEPTAFNTWFGNSIVKGYDGKPLVVYHGSGNDITVFDNSKAPDGLDSNKNGVAWFSDSPEVAGTFAGYQDGETIGGVKLGNSNIMPVYLSLQNPFVDYTGKYAKRGGLSRDEAAELEAEGYDGIYWPQTHYDLPDTDAGFVRNQKGEIYGEDIPYPSQYAVFSSSQIKSAVGNIGTYASNNDDIRYSIVEQGPVARVEFDSLPTETRDDIAYAMVAHDHAAHVRAQFEKHVGIAPDTTDALNQLTDLADPIMLPQTSVDPAQLSNLAERTTSEAAVANYQARLESGETPPPVVVRRDGDSLILVEGGHRAASALAAGKSIPCVDISELYAMDWDAFLKGDSVVNGAPLRSVIDAAKPPNSNADDVRFSFAGITSVTHDVATLAQAKEQLSAGVDPEVIRQQTGWMKGVDGGWRYEISDAEATIRPMIAWESARRSTSTELNYAKDKVVRARNELVDIIHFYGDTPENVSPATAMQPEYVSAQKRIHESKFTVTQLSARLQGLQERGLRVGDVLHHPKLFAAYPSFADTKLTIQPTRDGHGAYYVPVKDTIVIDESSLDNLLPILIHEAQHYIQHREGFARGGSESEFDDLDATQERLDEITRDLENLLDSNPAFAEMAAARRAAFDRIKRDYGKGEGVDRSLSWYDVPEHEIESYQALLNQVQQFDEYGVLIDLETKQHYTARDRIIITAHQQYRSLAGEVEARNTEARLNMSEAERQQTAPAATQDTPADQVTVLFNGEVMHSAPLPQNAVADAKAEMAEAVKVDIHSPEIKSWFLGSTMTNSDGGPLRLYHGTDAQVSVLNPSKEGLFGPGIYLTTDPDDAAQYTDTDNVLEVIVHTTNPYFTTADYEAGDEFDIDSPAIPFIRELFGDDADELIEQARNNPSFAGFGQEVRDALEAIGHDSIVVQWPHGGPTHVIPLYSSQVMITNGTSNQTDTAEFKRWFGDSKVVDENGAPLRVYHGTASDFPAFGNSRGNGFYFTDDTRAASAYAEYADSDQDVAGPNIVPAYLTIQNPLILDGQWQRDNMDADGEWEWEVLDSALYEAEASGHDGAILRGFVDYSGFDSGARVERSYDQYIAFRPEQIRSAIGNVGTYGQRPVTADEAARLGMTRDEANNAQSRGDIRFSASTEPNRDEPVALTETPAFRNWFGASKVVLANGQPMPVYHGTTSTNFVPAVRQDGSTSARAELESIAATHGIEDWTSAPAVLERWVRSGMAERFGVTEQDAIHARELMTRASSTEVAPSRVELGFDSFAMPEGDLELGSHFGTEAQAENFGDSFEFFIRIENPLRLPDLGNWDYLAVMDEARNRGVAINEAEYSAVVEASDHNVAVRELLTSKGYDGVVYANEAEGTGDSYIAFYADQIMSASQDPVLIDKSNPDIRFNMEATAPAKLFDFSLPDEGNEIRDYKIGDTRISLSANGNTGEIEIASVRTPQYKRGRGQARAAMQALVDQADAEHVTLTLGASPLDKRTRLDKLVAFYESLGFSTTGQTVNMLGHPVMGRSPKRLTLGTAPAVSAFNKALAGSKVTDTEGKPILMYHGTRPGNDIQEFQVPERDGVYFTPDVTYAEGFTSELFSDDETAGAIYPVYLDIKNPYVVRAEEGSPEWENFIYRGLDRAELEAQGYDGALLYHPEHGLDQAIAFDSRQIISAIGLAGASSTADIEQTQTPLTKWFGKSKACDDKGQPLTLYRGSPGWASEGSDGDLFDRYYTTERDYASEYAMDSEEGAVTPFHMIIENPYFVDDVNDVTDWEFLHIRDDLIAQGYDGIACKERGIWVPFNTAVPTEHVNLSRALTDEAKAQQYRIKSAIGNIGTFDRNSQSILFSRSDSALDSDRAGDRFHLQDSPDIELATHMPVATELRYQRAKALAAVLKSPLELKFVDDEYGSWIDIQENIWVDSPFGEKSVNVGRVSHGVAFINGELYELDATTYFYRDTEPFWSPVVHADNPAVAKVYEALTGKSYPIFDAGTGDPEPYERLIRLKADKGFLHFDGNFLHSSEYEKWLNGPPDTPEQEHSRDNPDIRFSLADAAEPVGSSLRSRDERPLRVYHGTGAAFDAFDSDHANEREPGFFFTTNKAVAENYAGTDGRVIQASLNIRNPYRMSNDERILFQMDASAFHDGGMQGFIDDLKADGYDGLLIEGDTYGQTEEEQSVQWVPFSPEQINITAIARSSANTRSDLKVAEQLQLFLDSEPDPSQKGGRTDQVKREAVEAVKDLSDIPGNLGKSLARQFAENQRVSLVGQKIGSPAELAAIAQVYRDRRFETFRAIFLDAEDKVVAQYGLTSRLPASTTAIVGEDIDAYLQQVTEAARANGATSYYLLHNHPTGYAQPSVPDIKLTQSYCAGIHGVEARGHVVIDTNQYGFITPEGRVTLHEADLGGEMKLNAGSLSGMTLNSPQAAMALIKELELKKDAVTLIGLNNRLETQALSTIPADALGTTKESAHRALLKIGIREFCPYLYAVGHDKEVLMRLSGHIVDAVWIPNEGAPINLASTGEIPVLKSVFPDDRKVRLSPDTSDSFRFLRHLADKPAVQQENIRHAVAETKSRIHVSGHKAFDPELISELVEPEYKSREKLIDMPITDFLALARDGYGIEKATTVKNLLGNGTQFNSLPFLHLDRDGRVEGHEGRHRARALAELGHTTIPVILRTADLRWSQQVDPKLGDYVNEWPETIQAEVGAVNPDLKLPFPVTREQAVQPYIPGSSAPATKAIDRLRFSLALDRVNGDLFGAEAVALKEKVGILQQQVDHAYETGAGNADELDAELEAAYDRLEEILAGMEEDGPTLGAGLPQENPMIMDGTDAELSLDVALSNIYKELYLYAGYQARMDDDDKAEYIRAQVSDLVQAFGGLADNVTDQQLHDLIKEAHDNTGRNRFQGRQKLEGIGRSLLPTSADNPAQSASSVPFSIRTSDLTLPINALIARHTYARPNSMTPGTADQLPLGSIRVAEYGSDLGDRYVDVLAEVPVEYLLLSEPEDEIRNHPSFAQYVEWAREGREAPLIQVNQNERGELISINRRRVLAAREAGITTLRAWVSPINPATGDVLKLRDVQAMAPSLVPDLSASVEQNQPDTPVQSTATKDLASEASKLLDAVKAAHDAGDANKVDELSEQIESLFHQMNEADHDMSADRYDESVVAPATEYLARAYVASLLHPGAGPDIELLRNAVHDIADSFGGLKDGVNDEDIFVAAQQSYDEIKLSGDASNRPRFSPEIESILSGLPELPPTNSRGMRVSDVMFHNATAPMTDQFSSWSMGTHVVNQAGVPKVVFSIDPMTNQTDEEAATFTAGNGSKRFMDFDTAWTEAESKLAINEDGVAQPYQVTPAYLALQNPVPGMNGRSTTASIGHMTAAMGVELTTALVEASGQQVPVAQAVSGAPYYVPDSHVSIAQILDSPECVKMLTDAGYDGAAYAVPDSGGGQRVEYRVFSPGQVLSGCPMAVITSDNAGTGLRFSASGVPSLRSAQPPAHAEPVTTALQQSASQLPLSLQLHHLGGLRLNGKPHDIDQFLQSEIQGAIASTTEAVDELESRLNWLGRSHEGGRHYEKTQQKLSEVKSEQRVMQRWSAPSKHTHMPWDRPLGKGMIKALSRVVSIKPGELITGKMAVFLAATTHGSIQKGINKLQQAGINGVESGADVVSWDDTSLALANHLSMKAQGERFHIGYHGSPHVFDRFDLSHMGAGEGQQAYGRGMYATDTLQVARHYQSLSHNHAVYFEDRIYRDAHELIEDVVPRICAQHPELVVQPTELHRKLGLVPTENRLEVPLAHYLRLLITNPMHAEDMLPRQAPEIVEILKDVGMGVMKHHDNGRDLLIFPQGGVRGINEINLSSDTKYSIAMGHLERELHWFFDASDSDDEIHEQFQRYLNERADIVAHDKIIEDIKTKVAANPGVEFYEGQLRDAEWNKVQAEYVRDLITDFGELSIRRALPRGSIYMVDIDIVDDNYLLFDKPFSSQSQVVQEALKKVVEEVLAEPFKSAAAELIHSDALASDLYEAMHQNHSLHEPIDCDFAVRREDTLVRQLDSMGVYGIKYLDGVSRQDADDPGHNYVVFNTDRMTILGRTTNPNPSAEDFVSMETPDEEKAVSKRQPALRFG